MQSRDRTPKRLKSGLPEREQQQQQHPTPASKLSRPSLPRKRARSQRGNGAADATGSPGKPTKQPSTDRHSASASERKSSHVWVQVLSPAQLKACPDVYLEPGDGDDDEEPVMMRMIHRMRVTVMMMIAMMMMLMMMMMVVIAWLTWIQMDRLHPPRRAEHPRIHRLQQQQQQAVVRHCLYWISSCIP